MDFSFYVNIGFSVLGGLGIFLLGMKNMSEGTQAVAGERLRKLISVATSNRLVACMVGTVVTSIIQSSSVTTVIVVGMVNAGLMTLMQAIGVILGANIGTTMTAWILAVNLGKYGLALLGLSALPYLFSRHERVRYIAMTCLGLGMVFFGLELMTKGFAPLKDMPQFIAWFSHFTPNSYFGVLKCCLVGAVITAIIQSSSATVGITMGLASTGVIDFPTAAALVLGENIGTTITAWLASLGASRMAKRAAYAHVMFNLLGVAWITTIFPYYVKFPAWILGAAPGAAVMVDGVQTFPHIMEGIAMIHTGFNVANVMVFLPMMGVLAKLVQYLVPDAGYKEVPRLQYIDVRMVDAPAIAIQQSRNQILVMADLTEKMLAALKETIQSPQRDEARENKILHRENVLDVIQKEIVQFLSTMLSGTIPHAVMEEGRRQLRMADEYESVGDYIANILKLLLKLRKQGLTISDEGLREILDLHDHVEAYVRFVNECVKEQRTEVLSKIHDQGSAITRLMKEYRERHLTRMEPGEAWPLKSLAFTDMLNAYRRIKDHALNIGEVICGEK